MNEIDTVVLEKACSGNKSAFEQIYNYYAPFLWRVIFKTVNNNEEYAKEILQETFYKVHRSLKKFKFQAKLSTWLYRIAYTTALDFVKKLKIKEHVSIEEVIDFDKINFDKDESLILTIKKVLESLSSDERFLLTAKELDGFDYEELSVITGKSTGALRIQFHRIKSELRKKFPDLVTA